ncbi:MAG: 1-deoxy-D-xylulose-5-phosphate reductoisomerase [candidate division NC10 bacterium]|nr:1-deoxy-D-xylulose-5-phosphate reductoisomerase [candidate division NC10 bacterium]
MKKLSILGSTGSIGQKTLEVVSRYPEAFEVVALAAGSNICLLEQQIRGFLPQLVCLQTKEAAEELRLRLRQGSSPAVRIEWGAPGLLEVATHPSSDLVVSAIVGAAGLLPTLEAIRAGKQVALANKESLVMAGQLIMAEAKRRQIRIIPIDSEHSAIFQCLEGKEKANLHRIFLTASGGPFRNWPREKFSEITPQRALTHPTWSMGQKVTIDSSTLMNKGLEVIEARWLFDLSIDQIDVILHPQCIIHSMVEFIDGSVLAQLAVTDMHLPIQYALSYPDRLPNPTDRLEFSQLAPLTFEPLDSERFPCLSYAYEAARTGGSMPIVLNAANEVAVAFFLSQRIPYTEIAALIRRALDSHQPHRVTELEEVLQIDRAIRQKLEREHKNP